MQNILKRSKLNTTLKVISPMTCTAPLLKLRNRHLFLLDFMALLVTPALALTLRVDGLHWWQDCSQALLFFTLISLMVKLPIFYMGGLYCRYWRYAGVMDLIRVLVAIGYSTTVLTFLFAGCQMWLVEYGLNSPRTLPILDGILTTLAVGGSRTGLRGLYYWHHWCSKLVGRRVLVVGAGEAGTLIVREIEANPRLSLQPVAFADDDPAKLGTQIEALPVVGTCPQIPYLVDHYRIEQIIMAIPSVPLIRQNEIYNICKKSGVPVYTLPGLYQLLAGHKTISRSPYIDVSRLLHRAPVHIDQTEVAASLRGTRVLVTGAGGSIGSELCRQIARCQPAELILLGHGENSIFEINLDLQLSYPSLVTRPVIVDIRDQQQVGWVVNTYRPSVIFHAAAHKHVPLMQANAGEAITNNIWGTRNVLCAAERYGVERLVMISTDKAVNPTSIMGATKRIAELLTVTTAQRSGRAFMAVRFGNVLGSRGSVLPIFQQQIAAGGPVTITHRNMRRFFMTIPEAVQLVMQAAVLGQGGEVFVLDMGQPIRILDIASDLIRLSGLEPDRDIQIVCTGIRPGEKLDEELFLPAEIHRRTRHAKIFMATPEIGLEAELLEQIALELSHLVHRLPPDQASEQLQFLLLKACFYIDKYSVLPPSSLSKPQRRLLLPAGLSPASART